MTHLTRRGFLAAGSVAYAVAQETRPITLDPLAERAADRSPMLMLGGAMQPHLWTIDGRIWGQHLPAQARSGGRVEITFHNMSMMAHPMPHLQTGMMTEFAVS